MSGLNIVLYEPEIPSNTGNIGRTCVATGTRLHLIEPLGFRLNEKTVRRAGMDYWEHLDVTRYDDWTDFLERNPGAKIYMATTKAKHVYTEVSYEPDCYIMFGKESAGIPEEILVRHPDECIRIPMLGETRSLKANPVNEAGSNSVATVLYEALRQQDFVNLKQTGDTAPAEVVDVPAAAGAVLAAGPGQPEQNTGAGYGRETGNNRRI